MSRRINPYLTAHLTIWGAWKRGDVKGLETLGYPNMTPDARLRLSPGIGSIMNKTPLYWPDRTGKWVEKQLDNIDLQLKKALSYRFIDCFEDERAAPIMGINIYKFRSLFDIAMNKAADAMNMRLYVYSGNPDRWRKNS